MCNHVAVELKYNFAEPKEIENEVFFNSLSIYFFLIKPLAPKAFAES